MTDKPSLSVTRADVVAAITRGAAGAIPIVGGAVAEAISAVIPNQKLDRLATFAELLAKEVGEVQDRQMRFEARITTLEGSMLLEEGIVHASRAVSADRQARIAAIVANGLTEDVLKYDRTRKLLALLESLNDSEVLLLIFYSRTPTIGSAWHKELMDRHPELLRPASRENGAPASERERGAIRDSYERTLISLGLLDVTETRLRISALGQLLLTHSGSAVPGSSASAP